MGRKSSGMFVDIICKFTAAIVLAQKNETDAKSGLLVRECGLRRADHRGLRRRIRGAISCKLFRYQSAKRAQSPDKKTALTRVTCTIQEVDGKQSKLSHR
jgi:hypothetical protein